MDEPVRVDRWLWAARLARTRALAAEAVRGGRVHVNGRAAKPSKEVRPGDVLEITLTNHRLEALVLATAQRRGPAVEAALLFEETEASRTARERGAAERRAVRAAEPDYGGRPSKRDRRRMRRG